MKKLFQILLVLLLLVVVPVSAKGKYLVLEEVNKEYYYDENFFDKEYCTQEVKMNDLKTYKKKIDILNNSNLSQEVYLLFESKAADGSYNDLMEYLSLKITLDDKVVYEGSAEIEDYATKKEDLHDFISIGKLKEKGQYTLTIEMNVSDEYKTVSNNSFAYIHFGFYQKDQDKDYIEIEELTPATLYNFLDIWVFCGVCVLFAVLLLSIYYHKQKNKYKNTEKKEKKKKKEEEKEKEENEKEEKK